MTDTLHPLPPPVSGSRRLASWSLHLVRLPYRRSVTWASQVTTYGEFMLLRLQANDGTVGVGEMCLSPNWFGATARTLTAALEDMFLPLLEKLERLDPAVFLARASKIAENTAAKVLIDNALWDLALATVGRPYWQLYGEQRVPVCWILTRQSPKLMADEAREMVDRYGFRTLKLKGGQGVDVDVDAVRLLRKAFGEKMTIFIDCNSHYDAATTRDYLARMAAEGVVGIEDPCPVQPNDAFARLQAEGALPILLDVACPKLPETRLFCERGARAIALKLGRSGNTENFAMAEVARQNGCALHVGMSGESHLGALAALGLTKALTNPAGWLPSETTFYLMFSDRITIDPVEVVNGTVTLPNASGLAEVVDWERVERLRP